MLPQIEISIVSNNVAKFEYVKIIHIPRGNSAGGNSLFGMILNQEVYIDECYTLQILMNKIFKPSSVDWIEVIRSKE